MAVTAKQYMESINPATEELLGRFPVFSPAQVDRALEEVHQAFLSWRGYSFEERAVLMQQAAEHLRASKKRLAGLITNEMGKPITQAEAEIEKCAWNCDFFAESAERFLADQDHPSSATESYVAFDPLGPVLAIMPWNFPFWQLFRFAAPALMAGNTVVMKHASNVPQCALAIEEVFRASGFPRGVLRTVLVSGQMAQEMIADRRIAAVTLTGSTAAGRQVGAAAGRAAKKAVLELGGSDPFIVLEDAHLEQAAQTAAQGRNQNAGQSCVAAKRFIVVEPVFEEFLRRFVEAVADMEVGDPADRTTQVGPLARRDLVEALDRQVRDSVSMGAKVALGGRPLNRKGFFYQPTILTEVGREMPVCREETFGPVAAVIRVRDADEAIRVANDSTYGLGAALWTRDLDRARRLAREIEAGSVFVNGLVSSDPRLPFGGVKESGYGRELSEFGIREFTNIKTIWIGPAVGPQPTRPAE